MKKMGPLPALRFWKQKNTYGSRLEQIPIGFEKLMEALQTALCSSAGLERVFSAYSIVHTKLRNRLSNFKVAKLVKVYRSLDKNDHVEQFDFDLVDSW